MKLNNNDDSHNSGLNLLIYNMLLDIESHPTWVCGLKHVDLSGIDSALASHPTWVCGLKPPALSSLIIHKVTPYVGVWIETSLPRPDQPLIPSHPTWVCGLKPSGSRRHVCNRVSHPTWVCGLKPRNLFFK